MEQSRLRKTNSAGFLQHVDSRLKARDKLEGGGDLGRGSGLGWWLEWVTCIHATTQAVSLCNDCVKTVRVSSEEGWICLHPGACCR